MPGKRIMNRKQDCSMSPLLINAYLYLLQNSYEIHNILQSTQILYKRYLKAL